MKRCVLAFAVFVALSLQALPGKLEEGDTIAAKKDYTAAIRAYDEAFTTGTAEARAKAGFKNAALKRELGMFDAAYVTCEKIPKLPGVSDADKAKAFENMMLIALFDLNNIYRAIPAAEQLQQVKAATPAQKALAAEILSKCKLKKESPELLPEELPKAQAIAKLIRKDHPRVFFNAETWPKVLKHLERPEIRRYYEKNVKIPASKAPDIPKLWNGEKGLTRTPKDTYITIDRPSLWGLDAARCALVYRVEKDPAYLKKAVNLLLVAAQALDESYKVGVIAGGDYYSSEVIYTIAAYDWIYNDLTPEERQRIGKSLLMYAYSSEIQRTGKDSGRIVSPVDPPECSGFYGVRMLKWYAALATLGDGIDDKIALKLLYEGYTDHEVMLNSREKMTGDDGGLVSTANNYTMTTYLWSTYNYLHTYRSATGIDRAKDLNHLKYFPQWCVWNIINGSPQMDGKKMVDTYDFGVGDTGNTIKTSSNVNMHMYEIFHFIPDDPALRKMALGSVSGNPLDESWMKRYRLLTPIFCYDMPEIPKKFERVDPALKDHARFFENLGIVFMRSGSTKQDTYACFVTNKKIAQHRHFDANSFMIYKYDFLALDTGTRIGFNRSDYEQLNAYYAQTVAHNTMLIHMPKEEMPLFWVTPKERLKYFSHGGQERATGDHCVAYETNAAYTYVAGDATPVYAAAKCELALRQFVYIYPDTFVIADRVIATKPEYRKEWLLHTQNEPVFVDKSTFRADDGGGRLFCRTLLPADAVFTVVGGPGKEFFASGVNWELPDEAKKYAAVKNYLGRYRVEVAPGAPRRADNFLHVIQVGSDKVKAMATTKTLEDQDSFGVELATGKGVWQVRFAKDGLAAGAIRLTGTDGKVVLDQPLRRDVQPQSGLE